MEEQGLTVTDQTDTANGDNSYQEIYVAADESKYSFEYYFMKDVDSAKSVYSYAYDNLDAKYQEEESGEFKLDEVGDVRKYEVSFTDYYCVVWQNQNTVLYVTAYSEHADEAKQILKELGY